MTPGTARLAASNHMLRIHNSLTGEKEEFTPLRANEVRMYVCGMTVYDYIHVGHARMLTVFDLVQRYLRAAATSVTYVRNITDIDDKIIQRAAEKGEDWRCSHGVSRRPCTRTAPLSGCKSRISSRAPPTSSHPSSR